MLCCQISDCCICMSDWNFRLYPYVRLCCLLCIPLLQEYCSLHYGHLLQLSDNSPLHPEYKFLLHMYHKKPVLFYLLSYSASQMLPLQGFLFFQIHTMQRKIFLHHSQCHMLYMETGSKPEQFLFQNTLFLYLLLLQRLQIHLFLCCKKLSNHCI